MWAPYIQATRFILVFGGSVMVFYGIKQLVISYAKRSLQSKLETTKQNSLDDRIIGMLLGIAIGDAKGITYENLTYDEVQKQIAANPTTSIYLGTDKNHAFLKNYPPNKWTDSTQLSLAMAKSLTKSTGFHMPTFVDEHIAAYKFRTDGWGFTNKQTIERLLKGTHTFLNSGNRETTGNGAVMKLCPLAFYYAIKKINKSQIISEVSLLTSMTHDTSVCKIASCLFVLFAQKIYSDVLTNSVSLLFSRDSRRELAVQTLEWAKELEQLFADPKKISPNLENLVKNFDSIKETQVVLEVSHGNSIFVFDVLTATIAIILGREPSFESILTASTLGGDCNITAAMVGGVIGGVLGLGMIPKEYLDPLEDAVGIVEIAQEMSLQMQK